MPDHDPIRARHVPRQHPIGLFPDTCDYCSQPWPCDTATVLAALDEAPPTARYMEALTRADVAEAREARLRAALQSLMDHYATPYVEHPDGDGCWEAAEAALSPEPKP